MLNVEMTGCNHKREISFQFSFFPAFLLLQGCEMAHVRSHTHTDWAWEKDTVRKRDAEANENKTAWFPSQRLLVARL